MPSSQIIDGRVIAEKIHGDTAQRVNALKSRGVVPGLVFIRVGEDPASQIYVSMKERVASRLGIQSTTHVLSETISESDLLSLIQELNGDKNCHGILVQAPVPRQINPAAVFFAVSPEKDVDGFHPINAGKLLLGDSSGFVPCTPAGIHQLLIRSNISIEGADIVVLGRGNIVGKPMAVLLVQKAPQANATVTICHSQTRDLAAHCRRADILIAAMGMPEFVKGNMVKPGATVIDVGVNRVSDPSAKSGSKLVGDVAFNELRSIAGNITPNPGGVGPMTIAMLMQNTVRAAELFACKNFSS
jgi:methylenetetrahydrofolate dehydrogenase (NADP+) / methenyltetrahydrofolate cyclohydrolase